MPGIPTLLCLPWPARGPGSTPTALPVTPPGRFRALRSMGRRRAPDAAAAWPPHAHCYWFDRRDEVVSPTWPPAPPLPTSFRGRPPAPRWRSRSARPRPRMGAGYRHLAKLRAKGKAQVATDDTLLTTVQLRNRRKADTRSGGSGQRSGTIGTSFPLEANT